MSSTLKILNKDFPFIPTDKGVNYLICKEFKEVFLGVYEIECHGNKLIAESVGEDIRLDVEFDGKIYETYFQLKKGDEDAVIFNLKNLGEGRRIYKEEVEVVKTIVEEETLPEPEPLVEEYKVVEEAKVDIEQYKSDAIKVINENFLNKKQKIEQLQESLTSLINGRLYQLDDITNDKVNNLRDDVLKSVNEALEVNKIDTGKALTEINAIKDDVATTAEFWSNILVNSSKEKAEQLESLKESVKFEVDTKIAELNAELKSQEEHITEAYDSIQKFIDKSKREFLEEKTSSFASVEALYEQVNKVVSENIKRAETLVGKKVTQLQSTADKKISDITSIVENKISLLDNRVKDIDEAVKSAADSLIAKIDEGVSNIESKAKEHYFRIEEQTKNINDIVNKNKNDFTTTVKELTESVEKKIKDFNLVAIKKEDLSQLKKQLETRLENESANLKKYVASYGGGGSVAQQFAVGGTMNGTLNVASGQILSAGQDLFSLLGGGGGGTGVSYLSALYDVDVPAPLNGQVLTYSSSINKWTAGSGISASGQVGYYGSFYDDTMVQSDGGVDAFNVILQHTFESNGIALSGNHLVFNYPGTYEVTYSIQFANSGNVEDDVSIWFRKNGDDISTSNSIFTIPRKNNANVPGKLIAVTPFITTVNAGDKIGIYWHIPTNSTSRIVTLDAQTNPAIPTTPGVIVTAKQVTLLQNITAIDTGLRSLSSNWQNTYTDFSTQSANNASVYSNVNANSASWNASISALSNNGNTFSLNSDGTYNISNDTISTGTNSIQLYSGTSAGITWYNSSGGGPGVDFLSRAQATTGAVKFTFLNGAPPFLTSKEFTLSSDGRFIFTDGSAQSTAFIGIATDTGVRALTSNWQNTYTNFITQSANNISVYTTVNTSSATWGAGGAGIDTGVRALTSNWQNTYTNFIVQSANNVSVYTTVNTSSATWAAGGGTYVPAQYNRWAFTGSPPTSAFSVPGATSSISAAYRVTIDYLLQDPNSYTVNSTSDIITFSEAPPLSSEIIVIEETFSPVATNDANKWNSTYTTLNASSANWQNTYSNFITQSANNISVYSTVNTSSATWSAPTAGSITGTRLATNVVGSSLRDVGALTGLTVAGILSVGYRGSADSSLVIAGSSNKGGIGYHDFLRVTNGSTGATNTNKYFRLNSTGELEVINSAYNSILFVIDDSGNTTIGGNLTINGGRAGYSSARPGFRVYGSGTTNNIATSSNTDGTLNSNNFTADYNQGGHLNTSTGLFTIPYTGLYQINVVGRTSGWNGGISQLACICPTRSDKVMTFIEWAANTTMIHTGASTTAYLTAGDTLKLKVLAGQINFDTNDNWSVAYIG